MLKGLLLFIHMVSLMYFFNWFLINYWCTLYPPANYGHTIYVALKFTAANSTTVDFLAGSSGVNSEASTSIKVPKVYWNYTCKTILTLEWIDGIKLTDAERISKANLNRKRMIDEVLALYCLNVNYISTLGLSFVSCVILM
jgi:hypothetical protein